MRDHPREAQIDSQDALVDDIFESFEARDVDALFDAWWMLSTGRVERCPALERDRLNVEEIDTTAYLTAARTAWALAPVRQIVFDDEEEEPDEDEPDEESVRTSDHRHFYHEGRLTLTVGEDEDMWEALDAWMEKNQFWPNVFFVSDHGNVTLLERPERE
jgi:hypothetical protein